MCVLKKQSIKTQLYEIIKNKILTQEYPIGYKLNITSLSKEFQVSNTPIREALCMLEEDGLVNVLPNSGFYVFMLSDEKIHEITESFSLLMLGGYRLAMAKDKKDDLIATMEYALDEQEKAIASDADALALAQASVDFDSSFFKVLENHAMTDRYAKNLLNHMTLIASYDYAHGDDTAQEKLDQHRKIFEAVKEDRYRDAANLIISHFGRSVHFDFPDIDKK